MQIPQLERPLSAPSLKQSNHVDRRQEPTIASEQASNKVSSHGSREGSRHALTKIAIKLSSIVVEHRGTSSSRAPQGTSPIRPVPRLAPKSPVPPLVPEQFNSPVLAPNPSPVSSRMHGLSRSAFRTNRVPKKALPSHVDSAHPIYRLAPPVAPASSSINCLPEALLFISAEHLLGDMNGLKEISQLFTQFVGKEDDFIKSKQKLLEVIYRFVNRPGFDYASDILKMAEFKLENIPEEWRAAVQTAKTVSLQSAQTPSQIQNLVTFLPRLQTLTLDRCTLDAAALTAVGNLSALQTLKFTACEGITDDTIAPIRNCRALTSLTVSYCGAGLSDEGIKALSLHSLTTLNLDGNRQLSDASLIHIVNAFPMLETLSLGACILITGKGFTHVEGLTELRYLNLTFCKGLFKNGLDTVLKLKKLETLILKRFEFASEDHFPNLTALANLKHLDLRLSLKLTDAILEKLRPILPQLSYFSVYKSKGFSPETLTYLPNATQIDFQQRLSPLPYNKPRDVQYDS